MGCGLAGRDGGGRDIRNCSNKSARNISHWRTRRETLLVCSPAAEAFVPPLGDNFIIVGKRGRKETRLGLGKEEEGGR